MAGRRALAPWLSDFNGDGAADAIVGLRAEHAIAIVYTGVTLRTARVVSARNLGAGAFEIGDVNGGGRHDLVVLAANPSARPEAALFYGSASLGVRSELDATWSLAIAPGSIARYFDANGDGFADVAVGYAGELRADVWFGGSAGLAIGTATVLQLETIGAGLVFVTSFGDMKRDGFDDLVVRSNRAARVVRFPGHTAGATTVGHVVDLGP